MEKHRSMGGESVKKENDRNKGQGELLSPEQAKQQVQIELAVRALNAKTNAQRERARRDLENYFGINSEGKVLELALKNKAFARVRLCQKALGGDEKAISVLRAEPYNITSQTEMRRFAEAVVFASDESDEDEPKAQAWA